MGLRYDCSCPLKVDLPETFVVAFRYGVRGLEEITPRWNTPYMAAEKMSIFHASHALMYCL